MSRSPITPSCSPITTQAGTTPRWHPQVVSYCLRRNVHRDGATCSHHEKRSTYFTINTMLPWIPLLILSTNLASTRSASTFHRLHHRWSRPLRPLEHYCLLSVWQPQSVCRRCSPSCSLASRSRMSWSANSRSLPRKP